MINLKRKNLLRMSGVSGLILISFTLNILSSMGSANTLTFDYEFSICTDCGLPGWVGDTEINVSSIDQSIVFNQKLILNCVVGKNNLQLKLTESGEHLTITEKFNYSFVANCNCPVFIIGSISNLIYKCYTLTFNLEIVQYNPLNQTEVVSNNTIQLDVIYLELVTSSTTAAPFTSSTPLTNSSSSTSSKISDFATQVSTSSSVLSSSESSSSFESVSESFTTSIFLTPGSTILTSSFFLLLLLINRKRKK